jgi:hypothetical protein
MFKEFVRSTFNSFFVLLVSILIFISLQLIFEPLILEFFLNSFPPAGALTLLAKGIVTTVCLLFATVFYLSMVSWKYVDYIFTKNKFDYIWCSGGIFVIFILFQTCLFVMDIPVPDWEKEYVGEGLYSVAIALVSTCVFAALWEEYIFRALLPYCLSCLLSKLRIVSKYLTANMRFLFSCFPIAVLFAFMHEGRTPVHTMYFIAFSLWLGYWVAKSRSLSVAVVGHSVAGLLSIISIYVFAT